MEPVQTPQETEALCSLYRQGLADLITAITITGVLQQEPMLQEAVADAEALLQADGPYALAWQRIDQTLQDHCYELRDYVHERLYGRPSTDNGYVPPESEIQRILADIETLTHEGYALHAALHQLRGEVPHA